jgi:molybdopterin-containing oxidoreductase family membrane subunit
MRILEIVPLKPISLKMMLGFEKNKLNLFLVFLVSSFLVLFLVGVSMYLLHGHHAFNVTREHPWGLLIAMYIFFVVSSTGLCIISSFGHVFGIKEFEIIGKRAIVGAIVTILSGFAVISTEIGHPVRMVIYNILSPGFTSAIWWMGTLYGGYLVCIIFELIFLLRNDHKYAKIFGVAGLVVGIAAHSNLGGVFGFLIARPISNGIFFPIYFILSAMITGAYLLFLMQGLRYKMKFPIEIKLMLEKLANILTILLLILIFFEIWRMLTAYYGGMPERAEVAMHIIFGGNFLFGELFLGIVIPLGILVFGNKSNRIINMVYGALIGMIGVFFMRYNLVHDTQLYPMQTLKTTEYQLVPTFVEYFPSFAEISISIGGIGLCLLMYFIADAIFDLDNNVHASETK